MTNIDNIIGERFEKAHPRREFAGVKDVAGANIYKTPYTPKETWWNAQRNEKVDPRFAVTAYQNMEEARRLDAEQDARTQDDVEGLRYQPEYPYEMFVQPLNRIGAMKPRETETAYFEEPLDMTEDLETHGLGLRAYRAALDAKDESVGKNKREEPEVYEFTESNTDVDGRMTAWHGASQHPERAGEFLRGYHIVNDKAIDAVKDSISPNGAIKESANETDPKEFMPAMADAAAEEGPDDFEAPGIKHMRDTKRERADAIKPVTSQADKIHGAEEIGRNVGRGDVDPELTTMDVDVDLSSYLEDLMDKGLIAPNQYVHGRQAFKDGLHSGFQDLV